MIRAMRNIGLTGAAALLLVLFGCATPSPTVESPAATPAEAPPPPSASSQPVPQEKTQPLPPPAATPARHPTPPELYAQMKRAAESGNLKEAVFLFAVAGSYSYYDTLRVPDVTLHGAHSVLIKQSFRILDEKTRKKLKDEIRLELGSPDRLPAICKDVARAGPPDYNPRYMAGPGSGDVPLASSDPQADWKMALDSFLHCSG